jgi:hypothetical protein
VVDRWWCTVWEGAILALDPLKRNGRESRLKSEDIQRSQAIQREQNAISTKHEVFAKKKRKTDKKTKFASGG